MKDFFMCIPSYNGNSEYLAPLLETCKSAVRNGLIKEVVLVDDGSTDNTNQVAENLGVTVLRHVDGQGNPKNQGKGAAFVTGVRYGCWKYEGMVLCDDDMIGLREEDILSILIPVREQGALMARSPYFQGSQVCPYDFSGFRAIDRGILRPVYDENDKNHKSLVDILNVFPWGLEAALELICPIKQKVVVEIDGLRSKKRGGKTTHTNLHNCRALTCSWLDRAGLIHPDYLR